MPAKQKTFEDKLASLEELVHKLEEGSLTLEQTLKTYEEGITLAKNLSSELDKAEARMLELKGDKIIPMEDAP